VDLFVTEASEAFGCSNPDIFLIVFEETKNAVVVQSVTGVVICKTKSVKAAYSATISREPHVSFVVLHKVNDLGLREPVLNGIIFKIKQLGVCTYASTEKGKQYINSFKGHK
jgi:hypothetical protein